MPTAVMLEPSRRKRVPALDRERRRVQDDDVVSPTPPPVGLDRTASAARSGRQELRERYDNHNETSPALTAGDVDADWESAYSTGDEAPGGDNPTPDQDVVDEIGRALGVSIRRRRRAREGAGKHGGARPHRWELDPASSEDFEEAGDPRSRAGKATVQTAGRRRRPSARAPRRCRYDERSTRATTASTGTAVVSMTHRVLRQRQRRRRARGVGLSRAASAAATAAWPLRLPAWALSLARRRARSSADASR